MTAVVTGCYTYMLEFLVLFLTKIGPTETAELK